MASGRDINSPEYFKKEHCEIKKAQKYQLFENAPNGPAYRTLLSGDGLGPARIASTELSVNSVDIETQLFGIGSSSVIPRYRPTPELHPIPSLDIFNKPKPIVPKWGPPIENQRPMFRSGQTILPRYVQVELETNRRFEPKNYF